MTTGAGVQGPGGGEVWIAFKSLRCICNGAKKPGTGFCRGCYFSLPVQMQRALWRRFGAGFEEAYTDAKTWLFKDID